MADNFLNSHAAIENQQSFYNVIKKTGWEETPFWSSISSRSFGNKSPELGHSWYYRKRPGRDQNVAGYAEGSKRADVKSYGATKLHNELQIFKESYGITNSQKPVLSVEGKANSLSEQSEASALAIRFAIEKAILTNGAPVGSQGGVSARTLGGLSHYIIEDIDAKLVQLDWKTHIKEILKLMWLNGCTTTHLMTSPDQKDHLDEVLETKKRYGKNDTSYVDNFSRIEDTGYAKNVKITVSPFLQKGEIIFYNNRLISSILHRSHKGKNVSDPSYDAEAYEHLFELTLQIDDPFSVVRVRNLKP